MDAAPLPFFVQCRAAVWPRCPGCLRQSSLILAAVTTLAQRARSLVKNWSCSAGVMVTTSAPWPAKRERISGAQMAVMSALLSFCTTASGVPRGTSTPCQVPDS